MKLIYVYLINNDALNIAVNGSINVRSNLTSTARGPDANSSSSSADGQEIEEERRAIRELLSKMQLPKVDY